jgi:CTP:molybdopterin cytidylyltransferase MocA
VVVLGADYERIRDDLRACDLVHNAFWQKGRFSSVQVGLRALRVFDGIFILPVDTVGVSPETVRATLKFADERMPLAVRPTFHGQNGKIAWLSRQLAEEIIGMDTASRLDEVLEGRTLSRPVNDPAVLSNVNTPDEWRAASSRLR